MAPTRATPYETTSYQDCVLGRRPRIFLSDLLHATLSKGAEYYKHVDEVRTNPGAWHGKRLQLHGFVVNESILRKRDSLDCRFEIENNGRGGACPLGRLAAAFAVRPVGSRVRERSVGLRQASNSAIVWKYGETWLEAARPAAL